MTGNISMRRGDHDIGDNRVYDPRNRDDDMQRIDGDITGSTARLLVNNNGHQVIWRCDRLVGLTRHGDRLSINDQTGDLRTTAGRRAPRPADRRGPGHKEVGGYVVVSRER